MVGAIAGNSTRSILKTTQKLGKAASDLALYVAGSLRALGANSRFGRKTFVSS
jgi:hypothetical protein